MNYRIQKEINELISDYETRPIQIMDGLPFNQYKQLKTSEFYSNSKYLGGNKDELQREKPFYNVVNYRVTLAKTATDFDIKDINISSDDPKHYVHSMLLQKEAYQWMKENNFAYFLNKMSYYRPKYGGVLIKKTVSNDLSDKEKEKLDIQVVDWRNTTTDQVNILKGIIVETHYLSPTELVKKKNAWNLSNIEEIIIASKKKNAKTSKYDQKLEQHNSDKIVIREVTGEMPISFYKDFQDLKYNQYEEFEYSLQHYFYADISNKIYPLFCEELNEVDFSYDYLPWEEMPGRALGRGVIEDAEEAQIWTNDAIINEKNAMDLAGKVVLKTDSKKVGANILEIDNGRIFELEQGKQLDVLNLQPSALGEFNNQIDRWMKQADNSTSSYDATTGKQPPADTPYSQTALLNQVGSKPFDFRREEAGIFITRIFEKWVLPFLIKNLYKKHLLVSDFTDDELNVIDNTFATFKANQEILPKIESGEIITLKQYQDAISFHKNSLKGKKRFLEIPKGFFNDVIPKVTVITTGEQKNKSAILQSLSTIMADVTKSYNPQTGKFALLQDPVMSRIFGTILELSGSGISPISLGIGGGQENTTSNAPNQIQIPNQQLQSFPLAQ